MTLRAMLRTLTVCIPTLSGLAGCHPQVPPTPTSTLLLRVSPQTSSVLLDDQPLLVRSTTGGPVRLRVPVGPHRLEVRALGHLSAYRDVDVRAGVESSVLVTLRPDPDAEFDPSDPSDPASSLGPALSVPPLPARL